MWQREQLKSNAKYVLGFSYWKALVACLIVSICGGVMSAGPTSMRTTFQLRYNLSGSHSPYFGAATGWILGVFGVLGIMSVLFGIFVVNPILVGKCRYFIANRQNKASYDQLFSVFKSGIYLNVVKIMFLRGLYTFLWSLLFVIPGIVKSYEYYMIPYILAENPQIDSSRAFQITRSMTDDEKFEIFVLGLSFYGWIFLGALACGIGTFFVVPYIEATYTELYELLKYKEISLGSAGVEEMGGHEGYTGEPKPQYPNQSYQYGAYQSKPYQPGAYQPNPYGQSMGQTPSAPAPEQPAPEAPKKEEDSWFEQQIAQEKKSASDEKTDNE